MAPPMNDSSNRKTTVQHWDDGYAQAPRMRLPSSWNVDVRNTQVLLRRHVRPGHRFLEIGCAPGKMLAWVGQKLGAEVAGLDYSPRGMALTRGLLQKLDIQADLRCEDLAATSFTPDSFDVVYSAGLIEHFDDPSEVVRQHVRLARPGGLALVTVPHYGGFYGRYQRQLDPQNLAVHNLGIMQTEALRQLAPAGLVREVRAYPWGRLSPWILSLEKRWPASLARGASLLANLAGLLQPVRIPSLCPMLVLELRR